MCWVDEFFIKNSDLYLKQLEALWDRGNEEAELIDSAIKELELKVKKILDIPCGIGRISIPLARMGYNIVGVDISPSFIKYAQNMTVEAGLEKMARFYVGDMRRVDEVLGEEKFDLVLNVFGSLGYYGEDGDAEFFQSSRRLVESGGALGIVGIPNKEWLLTSFCPRIYDEYEGLIVLHENKFDHLSSMLHSKWRHLVKEGEYYQMEADIDLSMRVYSVSELARLLENAGWKMISYANSPRSPRTYNPKLPALTVFAEAV